MQNTSFHFFIGIDVSKDKFNFAIIDSSSVLIKEGFFPMDKQGFSAFFRFVEHFPDSIIALESTGVYHINLLSFLNAKGLHVYLVNPSLVKRFAQSVSLRNTKTDRIDSIVIAEFIAKNYHNINEFIPTNRDEIVAIARLRENVSCKVARTKTQIKQYLSLVFPELIDRVNIFTDFFLTFIEAFSSPQQIIASTDKVRSFFETHNTRGRKVKITPDEIIKLAENSIGISSPNYAFVVKENVKILRFLNNQLDEITERLLEQVNEIMEDDMEVISSIKGIGEVTAAHFLAEIKDINRFENRKKLAAYAGLDPSVKQSGYMFVKGRISKRGSASLRRCIYIMATGLIRCNPYFRQYYLKKRKQGMPHRKAMIALCNKLVRVIFALLKTHQKFIPEHNYL